MKALPILLAVSLWLCLLVPAGVLRAIRPSECLPSVADYTVMWWAHGWNRGALVKPALLCIQTGRYGLALDVEKVQLVRYGLIAKPKPYAVAVKEDHDFVNRLPKGHLELTVTVGQKSYRCNQAALNQKDWMNFPVRMIENGRWVQRCDLLQLRFQDSEGHYLEADSRLEIVAWPDRLSLILEVTPQKGLMESSLSLSVRNTEAGAAIHTPKTAPSLMPAGITQTAILAIDYGPLQFFASQEPLLTVTDPLQAGKALPVNYDAARGWFRVELPRWLWTIADQPDRLDQFHVRLQNPTDEARVIRVLFDAEEGIPGITGLTPMLRDTNGYPTGIPVQLSKNWHRQIDRRMLYEGPWFHGFTLLRLPAQSEMRCEFSVTWARWGGVPAASHAQLCLVGWGWNQLWDQVAIGNWGESICYEPDAVQQRCRIDDIRPLMVWGMSGDKTKWSWTHNVGGGDFLVYYNEKGEYVPLQSMKTAYLAHGPNLTDVTYSGISADRNMSVVLHVSSPRCDDINRAYHRFRYDILKPTSFTRLAFYQLGSDNYHWHQFNQIARGNESGLIEQWSPKRGGKKYDRAHIPCPGTVPWFSLHDAIPKDNLKPIQGAWANRGLVIRSWKARFGGQEAPPFASIYGTEAGGIPSANLELTVPPGVKQLLPGDFIEAEVELLILPMSEQDYYGPNQNLRASLLGTANTWKPVYRQAVGNQLNLKVLHGTLPHSYPPLLKVDSQQSVEIEVTGGIGYMPISFSGLTNYQGYQLFSTRDGIRQRVDQSVHGNDFWQTDYDPVVQQWRITYNIPLDTPNDQPRTVNLLLRPK